MSYRDNDRSDYGGRSSGGGSMRRSDQGPRDGGGRSRAGPYSRDSGRDGGRDDRRREDRGGGYGGRDRREDRGGGHDRRGGGREDRGPSVFVGNIPWASTEEELTDLFSEYGKVTNFRLLMDRETNRPRGKFFIVKWGAAFECKKSKF